MRIQKLTNAIWWQIVIIQAVREPLLRLYIFRKLFELNGFATLERVFNPYLVHIAFHQTAINRLFNNMCVPIIICIENYICAHIGNVHSIELHSQQNFITLYSFDIWLKKYTSIFALCIIWYLTQKHLYKTDIKTSYLKKKIGSVLQARRLRAFAFFSNYTISEHFCFTFQRSFFFDLKSIQCVKS